MAMTGRYVVDGTPVRATRLKAGYPGIYAIQRDDGLVLGYVQRTPNGASEAYVGAVPPDTVGAQHVGTHRTMRYAITQVVRDATAADVAGDKPGVAD